MIGKLLWAFLLRFLRLFGKNLSQDYIKLCAALVNKFNNFNNICNVLHICVEKNATLSVGSCFKAIILIIIFHLIQFDIRYFVSIITTTLWYFKRVTSIFH